MQQLSSKFCLQTAANKHLQTILYGSVRSLPSPNFSQSSVLATSASSDRTPRSNFDVDNGREVVLYSLRDVESDSNWSHEPFRL